MLEIRPVFLSKAHSRLVPECWKSVRPSLANSLKMLFVGNPACSSSSEFLCRKSVHCFLSIGPRKIRSTILEIWQPIPASQNRRWSLILMHSLSMIEQFSSKLSPWPPLIHNTPILEFCPPFLFASQSSSFPILEIRLVIQSFRPSRPFLSVGNPYPLPLLNFLPETRSLLPFHRPS